MVTPIHKVGDDVPVVVIDEDQPRAEPLVLVGLHAAQLFTGIYNALDPAIGASRPAVAMDLARSVLAGPLAQLLLPKE